MLITFSAGTAIAQNKLYLHDINLEPFTYPRLELCIDNTFDCYGFQADLRIPNGLTINDMSINPDRVQEGDEYQLVYYQVEGVYKIGAFSSNHKPIVGSTGAFVFIDVFVTPDFRASDFILSDVKLINADDKHQSNVQSSATTSIGVLPVSISLDPATKDINKGDTEQLTATFTPDYTTVRDLIWTSSEESTATVDQNGVVTAVYKGTATITATTPNEKTATSEIIALIPAEGITLDKDEMTMEKGSNATLIATPIPEDSTDEITWESADPTIATVDQYGQVTAVEKGQTIISAKCRTYEATCKVIVKISPEKIIVDRESLSLLEGTNASLNATVLPFDADYDKITWTSSDETVATVDDQGNVTAISEGEAVITAWCGDLSDVCKVYVVKDFIAATGISLSNTELLMREGYTAELIAIIHPENATDKSAAWSSSDLSVATVDNKGIVTAIKQGVTVITASTANGHMATCIVTVVPVVVAVEAISLNKYDLTLNINETFNLIATITPSYATDTSVTWKSQDESIAIVSQEGVVTGVAAGNTIIYASSSNGLTAECNVTVNPGEIPVESISISQNYLLMREGYTSELFAIIRPDDATDKNVLWSSSNPEIASVDENGIVTAIQVGEAIIYASSANGVYGICYVTVVPYIIPVENIELNKTAIEIDIEETYQLTATITPEDATDKTVTWKSLDRSIATVSEDGLVTGISAGTTIIYASTSNGITLECQVTVRPGIIPVEGISLSNSELLMRAGYSTEIIAIVRPDNATDKTVTWKTDNPAIATFDANEDKAIISAQAVGTATITVTSNFDPKIQAHCVVTVEKEEDITAVESITLNKTAITLEEGDEENLIATITPEDATDKSVTWKSSNREIAIVDENGKVTAIKEGVAIIYASSSNGLTAECEVTVTPAFVEVTGITLTNSELIMIEGDSTDLITILRPDNATDKTVTWTSSDESIVTVDQNGNVDAIKQGDAVVSATASNGMKADCHVKVLPRIIAVESITINPTEKDMKVGEEYLLTAALTPEDVTDATITWKSQNKAIATVSENGLVTAVEVGTTSIYASSSNGLTAECIINVLPGYIPVESITLTNTELLMREGYTSDLIAIISPVNATDQSVTWASTNEEIATVDQNGIVTAILQGNTVVSATTSNGLQALCYVTVVPVVVAVEDITLSPTEIILSEGEDHQLTASVTPDDATDKTITWKSTDRQVAIVDEDGLVTGLKEGTATILASSSNGLTKECFVTVYARPATPKQLLRKGDGTTCTFIVMMDMPDAELTARGYRFVYGYTDSNGQIHKIDETPLRYAHTTSEIYNDPTYDFWAYSILEKDGMLFNSNLRHLDGSEEICFDASQLGNPTKGGTSAVVSTEAENWIKITPAGLLIYPTAGNQTDVEIYTIGGIKVFTRHYDGQSMETDLIEFRRFTPDSYIVVSRCGEKVYSKTIVID